MLCLDGLEIVGQVVGPVEKIMGWVGALVEEGLDGGLNVSPYDYTVS